MTIVYRGSSIDDFNRDEFRTHSIGGNGWDVWHAEMPEEERDRTKDDSDFSVYRVQSVNKLEEWITGREVIDVTGGMTSNMGTAAHFSHNYTDPGLVIHLREEKIPAETVVVEYDREWADDHPGALSHIDDLTTGEVHVNDQLWGQVNTNEDGVEYIQQWGGEARRKIESGLFKDEAEMLAFTDEVWLDDTVEAVVAYYKIRGGTTTDQSSVLADLPGYTESFGYGDDVVRLDSFTEKEKTKHLYREIVDLTQWREEDIFVCIMQDDRKFGKDADRVPEDEFKWVYNGRDFIEDYDEAGAIVGAGDEYPPRAESLPGGRKIADPDLIEDGLEDDLWHAAEHGTEADVEAVIEHYDGRHVKSEGDYHYYTALDEGEPVVVELEDNFVEVTPFDEWIYGTWTWDNGMREFLDSDIEEHFNERFWAAESFAYHATEPEGAARILLSGEIQPRNQTRGIGNQSVGRAVFASTIEPQTVYGDAVFVIDVDDMADGEDDLPWAAQEPQVVEARLREGVAREMGMDFFQAEIPHDVSPDTVVIHGPVPIDYLGLDVDEDTFEEIEAEVDRLVGEGGLDEEKVSRAREWLDKEREELGFGPPQAVANGGADVESDVNDAINAGVEESVEESIGAAVAAGVEGSVGSAVDDAVMAQRTASLLRDWGAGDVDVHDGPTGSTVEFATPFPGDQPIRSGITFEGGFKKSTVRYGVLDEDEFATHPANDPVQIRRLKRTVVDVLPVPGDTMILANFGDDHWPPRPHLLLGWRPSQAGSGEVVKQATRQGDLSPDEIVDYIKRVGEAIRDEYDDEYVA